jgi:hypothetical protein
VSVLAAGWDGGLKRDVLEVEYDEIVRDTTGLLEKVQRRGKLSLTEKKGLGQGRQMPLPTHACFDSAA